MPMLSFLQARHTACTLLLKSERKNGIPWIADFRDPWTNIDFAGELMLTSLAKKKHARLELSVLKHSDRIVGNRK
jgi:hypothetical protein